MAESDEGLVIIDDPQVDLGEAETRRIRAAALDWWSLTAAERGDPGGPMIDLTRDYLAGDCQRLAAAVQQVTGWPVAVVEGGGSHVVVQVPDGRYLDAAGLHTAEELCAAWEAREVEHVSQIEDLGWLGCGTDAVDYEAARNVVTRAGLMTESITAWVNEMIYQATRDEE